VEGKGFEPSASEVRFQRSPTELTPQCANDTRGTGLLSTLPTLSHGADSRRPAGPLPEPGPLAAGGGLTAPTTPAARSGRGGTGRSAPGRTWSCSARRRPHASSE